MAIKKHKPGLISTARTLRGRGYSLSFRHYNDHIPNYAPGSRHLTATKLVKGRKVELQVRGTRSKLNIHGGMGAISAYTQRVDAQGRGYNKYRNMNARSIKQKAASRQNGKRNRGR